MELYNLTDEEKAACHQMRELAENEVQELANDFVQTVKKIDSSKKVVTMAMATICAEFLHAYIKGTVQVYKQTTGCSNSEANQLSNKMLEGFASLSARIPIEFAMEKGHEVKERR